MGREHQPRDRSQHRAIGWRRVAVSNRRRYLIEAEDETLDPRPPVELRSSARSEVGDMIFTTPALSEDRHKLRFVWKITARGPAEEPFEARLTVVPGKLAPTWSRRFS